MFDIGWPELLVVAIVLIVVVGPKDLPPMLRAFGRTTKKLRAMASEFRGQFDEALREAELDDVKKTFDDARKLNPMQTIRDAVNPLKDTAKDIKADLEKAVKTPSSAAEEPPKMAAPEPTMKLADGPPEFKPDTPAKTTEAATKPVAGKEAAAEKTAPAAKPAKSAAVKAKSAAPKAPAAAKPAAPKAAAKATPASSKARQSDKPAAAKSAPRAKKPKQGEGQA
jgi:sec-independent protein translocase protein TatB